MKIYKKIKFNDSGRVIEQDYFVHNKPVFAGGGSSRGGGSSTQTITQSNPNPWSGISPFLTGGGGYSATPQNITGATTTQTFNPAGALGAGFIQNVGQANLPANVRATGLSGGATGWYQPTGAQQMVGSPKAGQFYYQQQFSPVTQAQLNPFYTTTYTGGGTGGASGTASYAHQPPVTGQPGIYPEAARLYKQGAPSLYAQQMYADLSPQEEAALKETETLAGRDLTAPFQTATTASGDVADLLETQYGAGSTIRDETERFLEQAQDPTQLRQSFMDAYGTDIIDRLDEKFAKAGRYGSVAHQQEMAEALGRAVAPQYAQMAMAAPQMAAGGAQAEAQAAAQRAQQLENIIPMAQNQYQQEVQQAQLLQQTGAIRRDEAQRAIDEAKMRYEYQAGAPSQLLDQYIGRIQGGGLGGLFGQDQTQTVTGRRATPSFANQLLGVGSLGLGIHEAAPNFLPSIFSGGNPFGGGLFGGSNVGRTAAQLMGSGAISSANPLGTWVSGW